MGRLCLIFLAGSIAAPALGQEAKGAETEIVETEWSLSGEAEPPKAPRATPQKAKAPRRGKPRLIGSARASNSKYRSRKGSASVGVAVPF